MNEQKVILQAMHGLMSDLKGLVREVKVSLVKLAK